MMDLLESLGKYANVLRALTGRQSYFLDVPGTGNAKDLSVVSFEAVERMVDATSPEYEVLRASADHPLFASSGWNAYYTSEA
ncbi:hypothetical protein PQQ59_24990 [Paraburkholderia aspalathi]|uniref:hypothetical protein n=1 Tax=Paraburkholderia aspalathi TaxID=1324617 RepID=UPI0038B76B3E